MNMDIQRTVLWVVFSMSILMLWDNYMRYTGRPSLLFPAPATQQAKPAATNDPAKASLPAAANAATVDSTATVPGGTTPVKSERITITTDVLKAEFDTAGGDLKRLELLKH